MKRFDETMSFTAIISQREEIEERLTHDKPLTPEQARPIRRWMKEISPPDGQHPAHATAAAISLFSRRLQRFTRMLRSACYQSEGSHERAREDLEMLLEVAEAVFEEGAVDVGSEYSMAALRGVRSKARLISAEEGCLGPSKMAELMGVQRDTPRKRWETGKLIGIRSSKRLLLPVWQLAQKADASGARAPLPGIAEVIEIVHRHRGGDWDLFSFFLNDNIHLIEESNDRYSKPLQALRAGEVELLTEVAEMTFAVE